MAILKHGKFYKEPEEHTATCPKCDCVFTYIDSMVEEEWQRLNLYESGHIYDYVICPEFDILPRLKCVGFFDYRHNY